MQVLMYSRSGWLKGGRVNELIFQPEPRLPAIAVTGDHLAGGRVREGVGVAGRRAGQQVHHVHTVPSPLHYREVDVGPVIDNFNWPVVCRGQPCRKNKIKV